MNLQPTTLADSSTPRRTGLWIAVACAAMLVVSVLAWRDSPWWPDRAWNTGAVAAHFRDVTIQRGERDVHLIFRYALTNSTRSEYRIPPPSVAVLMTHMPEGGLHQMESAVWKPVIIPAGTTVNAEFDVALDPLTAEPYPDQSADELQAHSALTAFAHQHLARMRGLVLLDYQQRYSIELPSGWD